MKLKVEGYDYLARDSKSNAIVNTSKNDYQLYINRVKSREQQGDNIRNVIKEVNVLRQELEEIKSLLKEMVKK
jgi:hypothetical protein